MQSAAVLHNYLSDELISKAIAVAVNPAMIGGVRRLIPEDSSSGARERLAFELLQVAPPDADSRWVESKVDALFAECFTTDAWFSSMPSGTPLIMVKQTAIEGRMTLEDAVRLIHRQEVASAILRGDSVPQEVVAEYQSFLSSESSQREPSNV